MIAALNAIFDLIKGFIGFIVSIFKYVFSFFNAIPNLLSYLTNSFSYLPGIVISIFSVIAVVLLIKGVRKYL